MHGRSETCICGNLLDQREGRPMIRVQRSPCQCAQPGANGHRTTSGFGLPTQLSETQYRERRALGLPIVTPLERTTWSRWW